MLSFYLSSFHEGYSKTLFEQIYQQHSKEIYKRVYYILKNEQDTEDVMQNIWLCIAENIDFYSAKSDHALRAYILRMAKNHAITLYRKRKKEEYFQTDTDLEEICGSDDEILLLQLCNKTDVSVICECINSLDEIYSDTLNYYYLHGHTVKEIAAIFHIKEKNVRLRLARGREKLFKLLEGRNLNER